MSVEQEVLLLTIHLHFRTKRARHRSRERSGRSLREHRRRRRPKDGPTGPRTRFWTGVQAAEKGPKVRLWWQEALWKEQRCGVDGRYAWVLRQSDEGRPLWGYRERERWRKWKGREKVREESEGCRAMNEPTLASFGQWEVFRHELND
jgi:hypothetical protein